jgi:hypothetical protein
MFTDDDKLWMAGEFEKLSTNLEKVWREFDVNLEKSGASLTQASRRFDLNLIRNLNGSKPLY